MANVLQLKRGTTVPGSIFYEGEPIFDKSGKKLYIGDNGATGTGAGSLIASAVATSAAEALLRQTTSGTSAGIILREETGSGTDSVTIQVPALAASYTLTLPINDGDSGQVLQTDGSGALSWVNQTSGFANWVLSDGTNTQTINSTDTVIVSGGSGISSTVSASDTVTIALDINELTALDAEGGSDPLLVSDLFPVYDASATGNKKVTVGNLETVIFADVSGDVTIASNGTAAIGSGVIVDADISATAEIAVSKLADGSARQLLQTDAAGTGVEWTSNIDVPGTLDVTGAATFDNNVIISGTLTVNGTSTTVNTQTVTVEDRLLELGIVGGSAPTAATTWDTGVVFNYHNGTAAKKSGVIWLDNNFIAAAADLSESSDTGNANPQVTITTYASVAGGALYIGGISASNQVINSSQQAVNLSFDGGTY